MVAGGTGSRMGGSVEKQFVLLGGKPLLCHTLGVFEKVAEVESVVLVLPARHVSVWEKDVIREYGFQKIMGVVGGGAHRQDSVRAGLSRLGPGTDIVVIHDGVRPFLTPDLVALSVSECVQWEAVITAVPLKDTVKQVEEELVVATLDRRKLWCVQTPQTFGYELITEAHERALREGHYGTDDAVLVERMGHPVKVIPGSEDNIKVTTPEDLLLAEHILDRLQGARQHL